MPHISDLAVVFIALIAGLARGFSGFGAALIFMPMASVFIGPKLAAPLLMVVDGITTLPLIPKAWKRVSRQELLLLLSGAMAGVPLGTYLLRLAEPLVLRWIIVALAVAMLAILLSGWRYSGKPHASAAVITGALSGLFSGVAQIGGPPIVAYLLGGNREGDNVRATTIIFFLGTGVMTAITYVVGGLITSHVLWLALLCGPAYGLGLWLGTHMFGLASPQTFQRVCFAMIALSVVLSLPIWGNANP
ncbi:MAG: sulfite exporter TauE/SafE family protein [Aestuariivirga sp.]